MAVAIVFSIEMNRDLDPETFMYSLCHDLTRLELDLKLHRLKTVRRVEMNSICVPRTSCLCREYQINHL